MSARQDDELGGSSLELKVGLFVLGLIALGVAIIVVFGQKQRTFERRSIIHTSFPDVQGLKEGAPVRLSGVGVGYVAGIHFPPVRGEPLVEVDLHVSQAALPRMGEDALARIGSQGLLGDKTVELSPGTAAVPPLQPGGTIRGVPPVDLNKVLADVGATLEKTRDAAGNLARASEELANPRTVEKVQRAIASLERLLRAADRGPGLAFALFHDPKLPAHVDRLALAAGDLARDADSGAQRLDQILAATDPAIVNRLGAAADGVGALVGDARRTQLLDHLDHAAAEGERAANDLAAVMASVRAGRGTIGALVQDPTVYDQLVTVLGGIGRSRMLRALVRVAIERDEQQVDRTLHDVPNVARPVEPAHR